MKPAWPASIVFMLLALAGCHAATQPAPAAGPPPAAGGAIQIVAGTYGGNCDKPRGNVSAHLASTCNGRPDCAYRIDHTVIGDPAYGCAKSYVAEWTCGGPDVLRAEAAPEAGYGTVLRLACPGAPQP